MSELDERGQRILEAAAELIIHYGYDKTTMGDIANAAGISRSTLYNYWKNKDDIVDAVIWDNVWRYADEWISRIEASEDGGTFMGMYRSILETLPNYPFIAILMKRDQKVLGAYAKQNKAIFSQRFSINTVLVERMQEVGAVRKDIDPQIAAYIMGMMSYGLVAMDDIIPPEEQPPMEAVIDGIGTILDRALTPADGGNSEAGKAIIKAIMQTTRTRIDEVRNQKKENEE